MAGARAGVERWQQSKDEEAEFLEICKSNECKGDPLSLYFYCGAYNM